MDIAVCAKVIPASSVTIEIDPTAKRMVRRDVPLELDPAAASAVEEALRLIEKHGGSVTVVTMGGADVTLGIRSALAMGATSAIHISDPALAGSDTLGTAKTLAAAIRKGRYDLVLCAAESSDSYSGIVPGQLAELLGLPPLTFAKEINIEGSTITVKRQAEDGYEVIRAALPALVAVASGINEPRYPQLKGIMAAKKKEIRTMTITDLGVDPGEVGEAGAKERVLAVGRPPARPSGEIVEDGGNGGKRIADLLAELKVL